MGRRGRDLGGWGRGEVEKEEGGKEKLRSPAAGIHYYKRKKKKKFCVLKTKTTSLYFKTKIKGFELNFPCFA